MTTWPKHPDGRPMKIGEMTPDQKRHYSRQAIKRVADEMRKNAPAIGAAIAAFDAIEKAKSGS